MKFEQLLFYWKEIGKGTVNFRDICDEGTNKEDFLKGFKNGSMSTKVYRGLDILYVDGLDWDEDILAFLQKNSSEFESATTSLKVAELFSGGGLPDLRYYLIVEMESEMYLELQDDSEFEVILYKPVYKKIIKKRLAEDVDYKSYYG